MGAMASQITSLTVVYSTVYSGADQSKHQSSASLAFVWGIHRGPVNSPHKWPVTRKMFPFDDVIMLGFKVLEIPLHSLWSHLEQPPQKKGFVPTPLRHTASGPRLNVKTVFPRYGDSHVKDKTVGETVLSLTWESPILVRRHIYIETAPRVFAGLLKHTGFWPRYQDLGSVCPCWAEVLYFPW